MRNKTVLLSSVVFVLGAFVLVWTRLPIEVWYRDGRPTRFGKLTNRLMGRFAGIGVPSYWMVALEVPGRRSGKLTSTVLVVADYAGARYLVSMLGQGADWVANVRAAGGAAVIKHGKRRPVHLVEVPVEERAPIIKAYVKRAPGGRPHIPVPPGAPVEEFEAIAERYPVFRIDETA